MARNLPSKVNQLKSFAGLEGYASGGLTGAQLASGSDDHTVPVKDAKGKTKGVAGLKTGEVVFTVESIIGAGGGNYEKGLRYLLALHDRLTQHGKKFIKDKNSLAHAKIPEK